MWNAAAYKPMSYNTSNGVRLQHEVVTLRKNLELASIASKQASLQIQHLNHTIKALRKSQENTPIDADFGLESQLVWDMIIHT